MSAFQTGSPAEHDRLVRSLMMLDAVEAEFDRQPDTAKAALLHAAEAFVRTDATRCGWIPGTEHWQAFARRRAESYGRAVKDGWPR